MQGWSPFRLSKGPLFSCQSSGKEAKMVPFSANKWSPFRLTNTRRGAETENIACLVKFEYSVQTGKLLIYN